MKKHHYKLKKILLLITILLIVFVLFILQPTSQKTTGWIGGLNPECKGYHTPKECEDEPSPIGLKICSWKCYGLAYYSPKEPDNYQIIRASILKYLKPEWFKSDTNRAHDDSL